MVISKAVLRTVPLLSALSDPDLDHLATACRVVRYPKGSIVFSEGDPGDHLLILLSGRMRVGLLGDRGQELTLTTLAPPSFLGEIALLDGAPRTATCIALEQVMLLQLAKQQFLTLLRQHEVVAMKVLAHLANCVRQADEKIKSLSMFDVHGRVVRCLLQLFRERGVQERGHVVINPRPSNQAIARMIGSSRETVSRAMKVLQDTGYIRATKATCVIEKRALERYGIVS